MAQTAAAQAETTAPDPQAEGAPEGEVSTIVVTGTRRDDRTVLESSVPVDVFSADDFKAQPAPQLQTILQTLVPSFNQQRNLLGDASAFVRPPTLRGLPSDQILVLINGKRMHRSALVQVAAGALNAGAQGADLSQISAPAIGRIEVLRDGAAAQYGSDAIAGVINLGLRKDTSAFEVAARYGQTYKGDGEDTQLSAFIARPIGSDGGFVNITGEFIDQNVFDRSVPRPVVPALAALGITTDYPTGNRLGGPQNRAYRAVINMEIPAGDTTFYAFGNYGRQRQGNDFNLRHPRTVTVAPIPGRPGTATISRSVNPVFLTQVGVDAQGRPQWDANGATFDVFTIPTFQNGFVPFFEATNEDIGLVGGFKGTELGIDYDLSLMYGTNTIRYFMSDTLNVSLGPQTPTSFYMGKVQQREFNFNGDFKTKADIGLAEPLFIAWGVEVRRESFETGLGDQASWQVGPYASQRLVQCTLAGAPVACSTPGASAPTFLRVATGLPGSNGFQGFGPGSVGESGRNNYSGYLDLEATVVPGLDIGLAGRYDYFDDFGDTVNGKFSARWEINDMFAVRGAASTGFRAPTPGQQNTQNLTTGFPFNSVVPLGILTARPDSAIGQFYLAQPLRPEKSTSFSGGLVVTPGSGFNLTLDYYNIRVRDRIGITGNINPAADVAFLLAQGIPEASELGAVRYFTNAFKTRTQGFDLVVAHKANTGIGRFNTSLAVNYNQTKVTDRTTITGRLASGRTITLLPVDDVRVGNVELSQPRWRAVLSESWTDGTFDATARVNYFGSYTTFFDPVTSGIGATPGVTAAEAAALYPAANWSKKFGAQASVDLEVGMTFAEKYRLAVGAQNLLNTYPARETRNIYPTTGGALNGSIYPDTAPIGQMGGFWYVRASARF
ncbi:MAG: TonB-dependent receptor [Novosphingobium sp.]|nr:TonB-dependent receptor [Novosphingobium sp.]